MTIFHFIKIYQFSLFFSKFSVYNIEFKISQSFKYNITPGQNINIFLLFIAVFD